jgi:methylthioribose-1-phosphate isomerase
MENSRVKMIDQRLLPHKFEIFESNDYRKTAESITDMVTRGAGAIGAAGAYAVAQAYLQGEDLEKAAEHIKKARPTAADLAHMVDRVAESKEPVKEAEKIADEYIEVARRIGEYGNELIEDKDSILTHCNAGALAFVDIGSALAPIRHAYKAGKRIFIYVDETRPRCQGSRLTAFELGEEGIPHAIIADNAAGAFMAKGDIDLVIVGADRIAANGDVVNKIGTYEKAVLAKENKIPFYVAAPLSTIDMGCSSGKDILIEERSEEEVLGMWGFAEGEVKKIRVAPEKSKARNPAFDVTPARYVTGIITEKGVVKASELKELFP